MKKIDLTEFNNKLKTVFQDMLDIIKITKKQQR